MNLTKMLSVEALTSVNLQRSFEAVEAVLTDGVKLERLITTLVLLAADRMASTPVNVDAGWENLTTELNLAASLRKCAADWWKQGRRARDFPRCMANFRGSLDKHPLTSSQSTAESRKIGVSRMRLDGVKYIVDTIETLNVQEVGTHVLGYLNAGYCAERLIEQIGHTALWDDTGKSSPSDTENRI